MFWIIGAGSLAQGLNAISQSTVTKALARQLNHVEWEGFRFFDLIFPLFIFLVGVAIPYSLPRQVAELGRSRASLRVLRRGVILFLLGIFYSGGLGSTWPGIRLMGVLNRIALAYTAAGLLFCWFKPRALVGVCAGVLLGYWAMIEFVPIRDIRLQKESLAVLAEKNGQPKLAADFRGSSSNGAQNPSAVQDSPVWQAATELYAATTNYVSGKCEPGYNVVCHFDFEHLPGKKYFIFWDPEGILSTIPAVGSCLLGVFSGLLLRNSQVPDQRKFRWLLGAGLAGAGLGWLWGLEFPVIKNIWSSSFVLVAGGYSAILLALFYLVIDVWKFQKWCQPFVWIGANSITIYLGVNVLGGLNKISGRIVGGDVKNFLDRHVAGGFGDLIMAILGLVVALLFLRFLYQRRIFLRV